MSSPNSPTRLYLMQVATIPGRDLPIVCYLIQTGDGQNIVVDSGLMPNMTPPSGMPTPILYDDVIAQLAKIGVQPEDVNMVICTHFDGDHAGNHDRFSKAEFIVQRAQYEAGQISPCFAATRHTWNNGALKFRFLDGDITLLPGLELIETSGHTHGHQSVLVRLPESGAVLLAIDAVTSQERFVPDISPSPMDEDATALRASAQKLLDIAKRENVSLVVFGHDGKQWENLRKAPEFYA